MWFRQFMRSKCFKKDFHTHSEGMWRVCDSSGPLLCLWAPPSLSWTDGVLSGTSILSPATGRTADVCLGKGGFCPASSPRWGIPRWKAGSGFCFYTSWQVTGPAPQFHCFFSPLERCPPQQQTVAIPVQDSWRTTEVPCMRKSWFLRRSRFFRFRLRASSLSQICSCAASTDFAKLQLFTHRAAAFSLQCHDFSSHLAACLSQVPSARRFFHVTRLHWLLIGQACGDRRSCCFAAAVRKVPTLQIKTTPSFLCDFSSCEISWICPLDIAGGFSVHAHSELTSV